MNHQRFLIQFLYSIHFLKSRSKLSFYSQLKSTRLLFGDHENVLIFTVFFCFFFFCMYAQSCPRLYNLMDCSPSGSSVHGISQARILEWVAISFSGGNSWPRDQTRISCISYIQRQILYHWAIRGVQIYCGDTYKLLNYIYYKWINCMVCEVYLNKGALS